MVRVPPIGFYKETGNEFFTHQKCCIGRSHSFSACVRLQKKSGGRTGPTAAATTSTSRAAATTSAGDHVACEPDHNRSRPKHNLDMGSQKCRKCSHRTVFGRRRCDGQSFREYSTSSADTASTATEASGREYRGTVP